MSIRWLAAALVAAQAAAHATAAHAQKADSLAWGPTPPSLPPGAQMAIVRGNPAKPGRFVVRFRLPDGFSISPHFHPADEHVRVISGEYGHGFGYRADTTKLHWLRAGERVTLPANSPHYVRTRGPTETEVSGTGPFTVTFVGSGAAGGFAP